MGFESRCLRARGRITKMHMRSREKGERASLYCVGRGEGMGCAALPGLSMRRCQEKKSVAKWHKARGRLDGLLHFILQFLSARADASKSDTCWQEGKQVLG